MSIALLRWPLLTLLVALLSACPWDDDDDDGESAPTALSYTPSTLTAATNTAITTLTPTVTGTVTSYAVSPALPAGLSLSTTSGAISGTPTTTSPQTTYTITATNGGGSTTATVAITVNLGAPRSLSYTSPLTAIVGTALTAQTPTVTGAVASYAVAPELPAGLALDPTTGRISGTATATATRATYRITATNAAGSTGFDLSLGVDPAAPSALSYASPQTFTRGRAIAPLLPTVTGTVTSYAVAPALPAGLALDTTTGTISGTPSTETAEATYTVTASNVTGSTTFGVRMTIAAQQSNLVLDTTFGGTGIVRVDFGGDEDSGQAVLVRPDGRIVIAGETTGATRQFGVAQLNDNGTLDSTFGTGGLARAQVRTSDGNDLARAVALQNDERIVVAGHTRLGNVEDVAVVRLGTTGALDNTFDIDGRRIEALGTRRDYGEDVVVQNDGAIVVLVSFGVSFDEQNFGLLRLTSTGARDFTFGNNGLVTTASSGTTSENPRAMALQTDGAIVVAGDSNDMAADIVVMRYTNTGALDASFGTGGIVRRSFSTGQESVNDVVVQSDGAILLGGTTATSGGNTDLLLMRLNRDGSLDTTYGGGDGVVQINLGTTFNVFGAMGLQLNGKLVIAATTGSGVDPDFALVRVSAAGDIDREFALNGMETLNITTREFARDIHVDNDGSILIAGDTNTGGTAGPDFVLIRYVPRAGAPN